MPMKPSAVPILALLLLLSSDVAAQSSGVVAQAAEPASLAERFHHWPQQTAIAGRILAAANVPDQDVLQSAIGKLQPQDRVRVVLVGHAPESVVDVLNIVFKQAVAEETQLQIDRIPAAAEAVAGVQTALQHSSVCCVVYGTASGAASRSLWMDCKLQLQSYVQSDTTLMLFGDVIHDLGSVRLKNATDDSKPQISDGLNLLPDVILQLVAAKDESDSQIPDRDAKLQTQLNNTASTTETVSRRVGLQLTSDAVVELNRRRLRVHGRGTLTVLLANVNGQQQQQTIASQRSRRQSPDEFLIDLTQWRRMALDQILPAFPPARRQTPVVENGTLLIVGGGGMPENLMQRMIELAGGTQARLVYVPCSEERTVPQRHSIVEFWKKAGVQQASVLHTKDRHQAQHDNAFLEPLRTATGIWFGGGRQWNFADSYYGTTAQQLMHDVLKRGGVIGGSSAGASIQGEYLARATPILNVQIMAPGYERGGLGFLKGVAIDQHFSQRNRQQDLSQLVQRYPQLLGIGIDEATALVVQKSEASVVGQGQVWFYQQDADSEGDIPNSVALPAGSRYNLATRQPISDP